MLFKTKTILVKWNSIKSYTLKLPKFKKIKNYSPTKILLLLFFLRKLLFIVKI